MDLIGWNLMHHPIIEPLLLRYEESRGKAMIVHIFRNLKSHCNLLAWKMCYRLKTLDQSKNEGNVLKSTVKDRYKGGRTIKVLSKIELKKGVKWEER